MLNDAPYLILPAQSHSPVFCFCDHATNHIPAGFDNLGLSNADLNRHIGWDIGAETLTRQFCHVFGAAGLLAGFSRLLIDTNRDLSSDALIPEISDGRIIPATKIYQTPQNLCAFSSFMNLTTKHLNNSLMQHKNGFMIR